MTQHHVERLAGAGTVWRGMPALKGGKNYAQGPLGAIHYRSLGRGGSSAAASLPILLLHQSPMGLAEWVDVQPLLAAAGRVAVAPDNPGYGMSDAPPEDVTVPQLADHVVSLLDHLSMPRVLVAAHHTGVAIAAALAVRHAERVAALVLHGVPLYDSAERRARLQRPGPNLDPRADGGHLADVFRAVHAYSQHDPQALVTATWATLNAYLAGPDTPTYRAVFANDIEPDLRAIRAPTLVLTDKADILHTKDLAVRALRPDFEFEEFSAGGSFALNMEPRRWVDRVLAFAARHGV